MLAVALSSLSCGSGRVMRAYLRADNFPTQPLEASSLLHNFIDDTFDDWLVDVSARVLTAPDSLTTESARMYSFGIRFLLPQDTGRGIPFDRKYRDDTSPDVIRVEKLEITELPSGRVRQLVLQDIGTRPRWIGFGRLMLLSNVKAIKLNFTARREDPRGKIVSEQDFQCTLKYYEGQLKQ